jgi:hypothetical protein
MENKQPQANPKLSWKKQMTGGNSTKIKKEQKHKHKSQK